MPLGIGAGASLARSPEAEPGELMWVKHGQQAKDGSAGLRLIRILPTSKGDA